MRSFWSIAILLISVAAAQSAPATYDGRMEEYLVIWADNANIRPAIVDRLYARSVLYYGRPMTQSAVLRDKLGFIRQWPFRSYQVRPGSVTNDCGVSAQRCRVSAVLRWSRADASGRHRQSGTNTVTLDLVREDGTLKIARESGVPVASSVCSGTGAGPRCSGFR